MMSCEMTDAAASQATREQFSTTQVLMDRSGHQSGAMQDCLNRLHNKLCELGASVELTGY